MKKFMIFLIALVPIILITIVQFSSTVVRDTYYIAVESVTYNDTYIKITKDTYQDVVYKYEVQVLPLSATDKELYYYSSNTDIATIDQDGTVTFKNFGEVEITAMSKENQYLSASCTFYVTDTKVHYVTINNKIESIAINESYYLETSVIPKEAIDKNIIYTSTDESVATIMQNGRISALKQGFTTITATSANGIVDSFVLNVVVPVSGIEVDSSYTSIVTGDKNLSFSQYTISPADATNKEVYFESLSPDIASINDLGEIKFNTTGKCQFVVITCDGNYQDSFYVEYTGGYILSANIDEDDLNLQVGYDYLSAVDIVVHIYPNNADSKNILFMSTNNEAIQVIDGQLKIVGGGHATISVSILKSQSQEVLIGTCEIFVNRTCESIITDKDELTINFPEHILQYVALPYDHTDNITFESSSTNTAIVSSAGLVSFKGYGSVDITIKANDDVSKVVKITYVLPDVKLINVSTDNQKIESLYGDRFVINYQNDLNIDLSNVQYFVQDDIIEYDDEDNCFVTKSGGETLIIATSGQTVVTTYVKVVRYANDIEYSYNTLQTTSKKQVQFTCSVLPNDVTNKVVVYSVDNNNIATIDDNGLLVFKAAGNVMVTIKADSITKTVMITSTFGAVTDYSIKNTFKVLEDVGQSFTLTNQDFDFIPSDYQFNINNINVFVQNNDIISVAGDTVTGINKGNTKLYVVIDNIQKNIDVQVKLKTKDVKFKYNNNTIDGGKILGNTIDLDCVVYPQNATNTQVIYSIVDGNASIGADDGVLIFNSTDCSATVKVATIDTGVYHIVVIQQVFQPDSIEVYLGGENVSGLTYLTNNNLKILPNDVNATFELSVAGVLDPHNVDYSKFEVEYADTNTVVENKLQGIYQVYNYNNNLSVTENIKFWYGSICGEVTIKFYKIESVTLALDNKDDLNYGLERKRVFGTKSIINEQIQENLRIDYTRSINGSQDELYWFVEFLDKDLISVLGLPIDYDKELAYFYQGETLTLVFNYDNLNNVFAALDNAITNGLVSSALEINIKVSVGNESVLNNSTVTDEYIYTLVPAFNIYDSYGYNITNGFNRVLQTNFVSYDGEVAGDNYTLFQPKLIEDSQKVRPENIVNDKTYKNAYGIYGNGYLINYYGVESHPTFKDLRIYANLTNTRVRLYNDQTNKNNYEITMVIAGGNRLDYCILENTLRTYVSNVGPAYLNKSIIRNVKQCGILIGSEDQYNNVQLYVQDCVMYDVGQCAISAANGKVYIRGRFDVYNFVTSSEFGDYQSIIDKAYTDGTFDGFMQDRNGDLVANVAIAATPKLTGSAAAPKIDTIYFYDEESQQYLANLDSSTGLNYTKLTKTVTLGILIFKYDISLHVWLPPINNRITPTSNVDLSVVYRQV